MKESYQLWTLIFGLFLLAVVLYDIGLSKWRKKVVDSNQIKKKKGLRVVPRPIFEINKDALDPFELDPYGRGYFATRLTKLFKTTCDGLVVSIDSSWGTGKTTFVKQWMQKIKYDYQFIPLYFDAFVNDHEENAFGSLSSMIECELLKHSVYTKSRKIKFLKSCAREISFRLTTGVAGLALPYGSVFEKILFVFSSKFVSRINSSDTQMTVDKYKLALTNVLNDLSVKQGVDKKIIVFIDELDRCRPTYAIDVIEKAKHFFNIDNVYFVLTVNKSILIQSLKKIYGFGDIEGIDYLDKFVNLNFKLPSCNSDGSPLRQDGGLIQKNIERIIAAYGSTFDCMTFDAGVFAQICKHLKLSPRLQERLFQNMAICLAVMDVKVDELEFRILLVLCASKCAPTDVVSYDRDASIEYTLSRHVYSIAKNNKTVRMMRSNEPFDKLLMNFFEFEGNVHELESQRIKECVERFCNLIDLIGD